MTETEWLACTDPEPMLDYVSCREGRRKLRLFACACCLRVLVVVTDECCQTAVLTAERFADGLATKEELQAAEASLDRYNHSNVAVRLCTSFACRAEDQAVKLASGASVYAADALSVTSGEEYTLKVHMRWTPTWSASRADQAELLRDFFGTQLFRPVAVDPSWLAWNGGTVPRLAQAIYEEKRFADLPVLADALEEAGCTNADILDHCRGPRPHVRGCWAVDLILEKL
jgi:hypothetical protein